MTTAHRPTFHAAIGGKEQGGGRYIAGVSRVHVHDLAGQMTVKQRQPGQGTEAEISKKDMLAALKEREHEHLKKIGIANQTTMYKKETQAIGRLFEKARTQPHPNPNPNPQP